LAWLHTDVVYPKTVTHPSTNQVQRRVTSFMRRTMLPLRQTYTRPASYMRRCKLQNSVRDFNYGWPA